ncbi:MAG TPA: amidohydrolase family protein [Luteibacter sp.]|nr:amidohydrolase family protein [Luteibacter sp.]HVI56756.1 amidohydrolase family protein [Luteibacter sp.]
MIDSTLEGGLTMLGSGVSRAPLTLSAGRVSASAARGAFAVDVRGHRIFPGLINGHEHLQVNAVPPLRTGAPFANSYAWIAAFQPHFRDAGVVCALHVPKAVRLRHGALKNLLAGTTFVVHHDPWHAELDADDFPVTLLRDHGWSYALDGPDFGPPVRESYLATPAGRPWMIHLAEGTDSVAASELSRLDALGCLGAHTVLVHGVGMDEADIERVIARGAAVVWCPGSNHALLGRTLDPRRLHAAGRLALGSDSRLSGRRDLLDELGAVSASGELSNTALLSLVTTDAARIFRLGLRGSLAPGAPADLLIVRDRDGLAADSLVGVSRGDIRAVVRGGVPRVADPDFAEWFAAAGVDAVPATLDGRPKLIARSLVDPAVCVLEAGLDVFLADDERESDLAMEAPCH